MLLLRTLAIWLCVLGLVVWLRMIDGYTLRQIVDHPSLLLPCSAGCRVVSL